MVAMECGIIGLPGSGKTSLFNALTGAGAPLAPGQGKPNVGVASIPDPRLGIIARHVATKKITPATISLVDIPGFDPAHDAARSRPILAHIREVDALCEVVRCFDGGTGPVDAARDMRVLADELVLADLSVVESSLDKAQRSARGGDAESRARVAFLEKVRPVLEDGRPVRDITDWTPAERVLLRTYGLMSAKHVLFVANVDEGDLAGTSPAVQAVRDHAAAIGGEALVLCAKLEAEVAELDERDRGEMLAALGLDEPAIGPLARAACRLLGLAVFYTCGEKEIRAWTVAAGASAPEAAGAIHTDMQRGFIRAECYSVDDLTDLKSEKAIKAAGRMRTEGKGYHIQDGDVMHILFSV